MTLEERAEEWAKAECNTCSSNCRVDCAYKGIAKRAYIAGYKARESIESTAFMEGKQIANKWHFVKDGDLPPPYKNSHGTAKKYLVTTGGEPFILQRFNWGWNGNRTDIIAWQPLPTIPTER